MNKLAIIGAGYLQLPLVQKAREMGLETHCFAWEEGAVCKGVADYFYPISIVDKELIYEQCKNIGIDGICTIASDVAAPTVAYVAERLHLIGNSYQSALLANDKHLMRDAFSAAQVPCPKYQVVTAVEDICETPSFPLIVKPVDRSGSLGVCLVTNPSDLVLAVQNAIDLSFNKTAIIEQYIQGREISVEFISYQGRHFPLQITDKITTGAPHFVELEHHQPADLTPSQYEDIFAITTRALMVLGISNGASHTEFRITEEGKIFIMELGARMGGDFIGSHLVRLSTGYDFLQGVIDVALGHFRQPIVKSNMFAGVYFLCQETEYLYPYFNGQKKLSCAIEKTLTDTCLKKVCCSADRSGYLIYQDNHKICLLNG